MRYNECLNTLTDASVDNIDSNPDMHWEEIVRETVEKQVFRRYSVDTHLEILQESKPSDEWGIYCDDVTDYSEALAAMAYTAMCQDVITRIEEEHDFNQ